MDFGGQKWYHKVRKITEKGVLSMTLGGNIHRLRTKRNMSQGDLAETLGVSRQSISKWETDGAVPELDKLIKLSNIFGVTLDELVHGEDAAPTPSPEVTVTQVVHTAPSGRVVAGFVLLGLALLCLLFFSVMGVAAAGLLFTIPFVICAMVLFLCKKHPVLYCFWTLVVLVDLYLRYATGLSWSTTRLTFMWTPEMNYMRLFIAWVQLLTMLTMVAATVLALRKKPLYLEGAARTRYILGWAGVIAVTLIMRWGTSFLLRNNPVLLHFVSSGIALNLVTSVLDYLRLFLLTVQISKTLRWWITRRTSS